MGNDVERDAAPEGECIVHTHPVPPAELGRYSIDSDPHSEMDIANYVGGQARDETIQHVEKIKQEIVLGDIRYFLSEAHDLVNKQGTRLRRHELSSTGKHPKRFFPRLMYVDKGKGA
jgi:hypothetical protein